MLRSLSLLVSGSFLFAGVAFAEGEEEAAPAEAAPAKGPAPKRAVARAGMKKMMMPRRPMAKADPEAVKKMDECRNKCLTDKSTGDDRLKCFFACRKGVRGFLAPYAAFKPCAEASRACRKDKCKVSAHPFRPKAVGKGPMIKKGGPGAKRPMVGNRPRPGQKRAGQANVGRPGQQGRPGQAKVLRPGQRPLPAKRVIHSAGHGKGGLARLPMRPRMNEETRKCLQECGKAHRACLADVLAKATPASGEAPAAAAETTTETKTEEAPAAATETTTEETTTEETTTEETPSEESTEGGSETP